jgi:prepilin-type processing-associated H-X9-DG protein
MTAAALMHAHEHKGFLPLAGHLVAPPRWQAGRDAYAAGLNDTGRRRYTYATCTSRGSAFVVVPLPGALAPYMGWKNLPYHDWDRFDQALNDSGLWRRFMCPATESFAKHRATSDPNDATLVGQGTMMVFVNTSGTDDGAWSTNSDYALNEGLLGYHSDPRYDDRRLRGHLSRLRRADEVVLFTDGLPRQGQPATSFAADPWICWTPALESDGGVTLADAFAGNGKAVDKSMFDPHRHGGRINIAFADGHVAALRITKDDLAGAHLLPR